MPRLRSLFLVEFDPIVGPKISAEAPRAAAAEHALIMDAQAEYFITKPFLCGRVVDVISVSPVLPHAEDDGGGGGADGVSAIDGDGSEAGTSDSNSKVSADDRRLRVVGFPVRLDGDKYPRNFLQFNLCLVLEPDGGWQTPTQLTASAAFAALDDAVVDDRACASVESFHAAARSLGMRLRALEVESGFFSATSGHERLQKILEELYVQLRESGSCAVPVDPANTIRFQLPRKSRATAAKSVVRAWDVPVLVSAADCSWGDADLAMQQVLPHIDGVRSVAEIARDAGVHSKIALECMRHLCRYDVVALVDIFSPDNVYRVSPSLHRMLQDDEPLAERCLDFVRQQRSPPPGNSPHIDDREQQGKDQQQQQQQDEEQEQEQEQQQEHQEQQEQAQTQAREPAEASRASPELGPAEDDALRIRAELFRLYNSFQSGQSPRTFLSRHGDALESLVGESTLSRRAQVHKFVVYGKLNGILCRVYEHPCAVVSYHDPALRRSVPEREVRLSLDGLCSMDEIAVKVGLPLSTLRESLAAVVAEGLVILPSMSHV